MSRITMTGPLSADERELVEAAVATGEVGGACTVLLELLSAHRVADAEFRMYANWFDVNPEAAGTVFTSRGKQYLLTGFAPNSPKFPILADEMDGPNGNVRHLKFTRDAAKAINAAYDKAHPTVSA